MRLRDDPNSCVHGKIVKIKVRLIIPTNITVAWFDKEAGPTQSEVKATRLLTLKQSEYSAILEQ